MNFDTMPELRMKYGYPAALTAIALVCGILYRRFKKAGWL
jgi:magnesium transporter